MQDKVTSLITKIKLDASTEAYTFHDEEVCPTYNECHAPDSGALLHTALRVRQRRNEYEGAGSCKEKDE